MWKFLLTLAIVVTFCEGRPKNCPAPFVPVGNRCLYFGTLANLAQDDARQMCRSLNGELMAIRTASQFKDLMDYIYSHGYVGSNFWIDGSNLGPGGQWLTSDGHSLPMGTPFWAASYGNSEPDNNGGDEHCIEINSGDFYYQNDLRCSNLRSPLCELRGQTTEEEPPTPPVRTCPPFFVALGNHCIAFITWAQNTWAEARQVCHGMAGELATISDIELLREIYLYIHRESISDHSFWIGGSDTDHEGAWTWTNGESISRGTPFWGRYTESYGQEPQGGTGENCLYLDFNAGHYFFDLSCNTLLNPLCMAY